MNHRWETKGEKRTIAVEYQPSTAIMKYLHDMQDALRAALTNAYVMAGGINGEVPSPIALRRRMKPWFDSRYTYAKHHINPLCRQAVALLKAYRKKHKKLGVPRVKKLAMRIDSELFRIEEEQDDEVTVRITLQAFRYEYIRFKPKHKKWNLYNGKASELLLTDRILYLTFVVGEWRKPLGKRFTASDLNFKTVDSTTVAAMSEGKGSQLKLERVETESIRKIVRIQNDFSRRRRRLQLHVKNSEKRSRKLKETRGRQRNRINNALHKLSSQLVSENPDTTFIFERLTGIRNIGTKRCASRKLRTYLNRWPYCTLQKMVEYKSRCRVMYVRPGGTSSECPVCGGRLEHPAWVISRCRTCGVDYDRDRLASLAILLRGLRLCGQPFAVSADASWQALKNEYLCTGGMPGAAGAGWTEAANAPNKNAVHENTHS